MKSNNSQQLSQTKNALLTKWMEQTASRKTIPKRGNSTSAPLSFAQQRLWLLEQMVPGSSTYNMHDAVRIKGKVDAVILQRALGVVVARHDILRTTFELVNNQPMQKISLAKPFELPIEDMLNTEKEFRESRALEIAIQESRRPFDLEKGPLFRGRLIRIDEDDQILIWTMHHIISDGWSLGIIIKEVLGLSEAFKQGKPNPFPPLELQYGDFAEWQRNHPNVIQENAQLDFWRNKLQGVLPVLNLPTDRTRPPVSNYVGKRCTTTYPLWLSEALQKLALQENSTLFMVLLSAYYVLLQRYSNETDILVGIPVANRNRAELHDLIGYFSNTIVMRGDLSDNPVFLALLRQIRTQSLASYENQDISFEKLVDELQPVRSVNRAPIFQVMFVLQNEPILSIEQDEIQIIPLDIHNGTSKFDLLLNIFETPTGLNVGIEYNSELFEEESILRMLEHYQILLGNIISDPVQTVCNIPIINNIERDRLLLEFNQADHSYDLKVPHLIHRLIEAQVKLTPDAIALKFGSQRLTYEELDKESNQLAHYLRSLGIDRNSILAIHLSRSLELVIALLAIHKAGGAFLPLDMDYPENRLSYMLDDSKASILICRGEIPSWVDTANLQCILFNRNCDTIKTFPESHISIDMNENDLAYVIYTSGSTGHPKGAMNTHKGICNRLLWMQQEYKISSRDRILQKTPFSFDVSVWEFFWPLLAGAQLIVAPPGAHRDSRWLAEIIQQEAITTIHFVPSMLRIFLQDKASANCVSLMRVICSGEALSYDLKNQFLNNFDCELHNLYGPTEAAIDVTYWNCVEETDKKIVPIGRPIANTKIYILDEYLQPVPMGLPGEIYIGGAGVGLGYLNKEILTQERFILDPFSRNQSRLYKTGDLARFMKNGVIEFLGRIDHHQVKIRGIRIELNEIESAISSDASVAQSVVTTYADSLDHQKLIAYVVPALENDNQSEFSIPVEEQITEWRMVFEKFYGQVDINNLPLRNFISWNSAYTGKPIPIPEMNEWLDVTLERIRMKKARKILEIGCGTGLLLLELAKDCELYVGTDISVVALDCIRKVLTKTSIKKDVVHLLQREAGDFSELENFGGFDLVIINSVVQYFPNLDYFLAVISKSVQVVKSEGAIFIGDIKNFSLDEEFHASVELQRIDESETVSKLVDNIQRSKWVDRELAIAPALFACLPEIDKNIVSSEVMLRRGKFKNEMCLYRYDVFLELNKTCLSNQHKPTKMDDISWSLLEFSYNKLNLRLQAGLQKPMRVNDIPNERIVRDVYIASCIKQYDKDAKVIELKNKLNQFNDKECVDPEVIFGSWDKTYKIHITCSDSGNKENFDAIFIPKKYVHSVLNINKRSQKIDTSFLQHLASIPNKDRNEKQFILRLKEKLRKSLPEYMVPDRIVLLQSLPLMHNGKIDLRFLPAPDKKHISLNSNFIAASTPIEKIIGVIWAELLDVEQLGKKDNFFELGGNSLLAAQMVLILRERAGFNVPLQVLFQGPTIEIISAYIEDGSATNADQARMTWTKMQKDSFLPATIVGKALPAISKSPSVILLTGATGFLGAYLLRDLLNNTNAKIICLVWAKNAKEGLERVKNTLVLYKLQNAIDFARIEILVGNLEYLLFGLLSDQYNRLALQVDAIYHCAAKVNFMSSYDQSRDANVNGMIEVLRLASTHNTKPVHYISTIYAFVDADRDVSSMIHENCKQKHGEMLQMGYLQTKWVGEQLAESARDRGIPINIYRPGRIGGDTLNGYCPENDFFWGIVRACLRLGACPTTGLDENITPVDYVSDSIVRLSLGDSKLNQNYHLINTETLSNDFLIKTLQDYGYQIRPLDSEKWREYALSKIDLAEDDPSTKLAGFFLNENYATDPEFCNAKTIFKLNEMGIAKPSIMTAELLFRYIKCFIENNFFPVPSRELNTYE